jgi:hypothetical protein
MRFSCKSVVWSQIHRVISRRTGQLFALRRSAPTAAWDCGYHPVGRLIGMQSLFGTQQVRYSGRAATAEVPLQWQSLQISGQAAAVSVPSFCLAPAIQAADIANALRSHQLAMQALRLESDQRAKKKQPRRKVSSKRPVSDDETESDVGSQNSSDVYYQPTYESENRSDGDYIPSDEVSEDDSEADCSDPESFVLCGLRRKDQNIAVRRFGKRNRNGRVSAHGGHQRPRQKIEPLTCKLSESLFICAAACRFASH